MSTTKMYDFYVEYFYQEQMRRRPTGSAVVAQTSARELAQQRLAKIHDVENISKVLAQTPHLDQEKRNLLRLLCNNDESWKVEDLYALWRRIDCVATPPRPAFRRAVIERQDAFGQENLLDVFFEEDACDDGAAYEQYVVTQLRRGQAHHLSIAFWKKCRIIKRNNKLEQSGSGFKDFLKIICLVILQKEEMNSIVLNI